NVLFNQFSGFTDHNIQYFVSYPLFAPNGVLLGSVNIYDTKPNALNNEQKNYFKKVAGRLTQLISERRSVQEYKLRELLFESSDDLIAILNFQGQVLRVNPAFARLLGYEVHEIVNRHFSQFVHADDVSSFETIVKDYDHKPLSKFVLRLTTKTGELRYIHWVGTLEDKTELIFAIGRDVSHVEEQKKHISKSENRFRAFFENSHSLICMHSLDGSFQLVNKTGAEM